MSTESQSAPTDLSAKSRRPESFQQLADQVFEDFLESEALHNPSRWEAARTLFERLAGSPLSGELVSEVRLVLSGDGKSVRRMAGIKRGIRVANRDVKYEFRLVFVVNPAKNPLLCTKLGISPPPQAIHLRVAMTVVDNITSGRKYAYWTKLAVLPRDAEKFAHELVLISGTLEDVRLFHIMDLLSAAAYSFGSDRQDLPLDRPKDHCRAVDERHPFAFSHSAHLYATIAYVVRNLCSEWRSTEVWKTSDQRVQDVLGPLHTVLFKNKCYDSSRDILNTFLKRWTTGDYLGILERSDLQEGSCRDTLRLFACPNVRAVLIRAFIPAHTKHRIWHRCTTLAGHPIAVYLLKGMLQKRQENTNWDNFADCCVVTDCPSVQKRTQSLPRRFGIAILGRQ